MKSIKTFAAFFCAALMMSLVGCSKDPEDLIIGTWDETSVIYTETVDGVTGEPISMLESGEKTTITFNEDKTYTSTYVSNVGTSTDAGTYLIEDGKLTITANDYPISMVYTIDNIDKKDMTLTNTETWTDDGVSYSTTIRIVLKKI